MLKQVGAALLVATMVVPTGRASAQPTGRAAHGIFDPPKVKIIIKYDTKAAEVEVWNLDITGSIPPWVPKAARPALAADFLADVGNGEPVTIYVRTISSNSVSPASNLLVLHEPGVRMPRYPSINPLWGPKVVQQWKDAYGRARAQATREIAAHQADARRQIAQLYVVPLKADPTGTDVFGGVAVSQTLLAGVPGERELVVVSDVHQESVPMQDRRLITDLHGVRASLFQVCLEENYAVCKQRRTLFHDVVAHAGASVAMYDITQINTVSADR